jgi:hypothetical protein
MAAQTVQVSQASQAAPNYETMTKTDFAGNDIKSLDNATLQLCRDNCNGDSKCLGFNHSNPTGNGTCWLKHTLGSRSNTDFWTFYKKNSTGPSLTLKEGEPVMCTANDVGSGVDYAVYRHENGKLRFYPNPYIANTWDTNWPSYKKIDCKGLTKGADMTLKLKLLSFESGQFFFK